MPAANTVTYVVIWGNFSAGDLVEMRNETGNVGRLITVLSSGLTRFNNITVIARYDARQNCVLPHEWNATKVASMLWIFIRPLRGRSGPEFGISSQLSRWLGTFRRGSIRIGWLTDRVVGFEMVDGQLYADCLY